MLRYLFDASAVVEAYLPSSPQAARTLNAIFSQREALHQAVFFIPTFCIVEVFNAFARHHFDPTNPRTRIDRSNYEKLLKRFRRDIRWGRRFYPYDLNRYHILAADEIIPVEHAVARRNERDHLSTYDILVIAIGCELTFLGPRENVFLVTADKRIHTVCAELRQFDKAARARMKVPKPYDEPDSSRWFPPKALYLPGLKPAELPVVGDGTSG